MFDDRFRHLFDDDAFDGNDDHISALKDGVEELVCIHISALKDGVEELVCIANDLAAALQRLQSAAFNRDTTTGDLCRLLDVKAELRAAEAHARDVLASHRGEANQQRPRQIQPD